jgi:hypothetical protein
MRDLLGLMLAALMSLATPSVAATEVDGVVYGPTPGRCCAAIAAAREGTSVTLLEPTAHAGAMSTGGLSHFDSNQMMRSAPMGSWTDGTRAW